jgi:hypothetical protein
MAGDRRVAQPGADDDEETYASITGERLQTNGKVLPQANVLMCIWTTRSPPSGRDPEYNNVLERLRDSLMGHRRRFVRSAAVSTTPMRPVRESQGLALRPRPVRVPCDFHRASFPQPFGCADRERTVIAGELASARRTRDRSAGRIGLPERSLPFDRIAASSRALLALRLHRGGRHAYGCLRLGLFSWSAAGHLRGRFSHWMRGSLERINKSRRGIRNKRMRRLCLAMLCSPKWSP